MAQATSFEQKGILVGRIEETFKKLREKEEVALIPYLTAGDPDLDTTLSLILEMDRQGADLIELGVPFSDPAADGPTIQEASVRALKRGVTLVNIMDMISSLRNETDIPIILFGYYNPFFHYGVERLALRAKEVGVDAFLVVDLPPEEVAEFQVHLDPLGIDFIFLLSPTTPLERVRMVDKKAGGFLYAISLTGITGAREQLPPELEEYVSGIRKTVSLPVAVGFGISTPQQAAVVAGLADGVVIGSAVVKKIHDAPPGEAVQKVGKFIKVLKEAVREGKTRQKSIDNQ